MDVRLFPTRAALSSAAATRAASLIRDAIVRNGQARIVAATAASQLDFLASLAAAPDIDWSCVELFHLDEYVGLPDGHPASFRGLLRTHLIEKTGITRHHLLDTSQGAAAITRTVGAALAAAPVDCAFVGIGENAHLAFNDPPANFEATDPYIIVNLDEACRRQQVGEGWFPTLADVPTQALSMSIRQILVAREILTIVPDRRKAAAVRATLGVDIGPLTPASILRTHPRVTLYLDVDSASELEPALRAQYGLA